MKQTAVEWLFEQFISGSLPKKGLLEQAKEMEKQQIENAFYKGIQEQTARVVLNCLATSPEQYYNETFNNDQL
jgi:hypothetical protein